MNRATFEELTYDLYRKLNEEAEERGWRWYVGDTKNEFWVWTKDAVAQVADSDGDDNGPLCVTSSTGVTTFQSSSIDAYEAVFGALEMAG